MNTIDSSPAQKPARPLRWWHIVGSGAAGFVLGAVTIIGGALAVPLDDDGSLTAKESARKSLEAQGIVYSDADWEKTVSEVCEYPHPDIRLGIEGSIERNRRNMSDTQLKFAPLEFGRAPNVELMNGRERQMVLDIVTRYECE